MVLENIFRTHLRGWFKTCWKCLTCFCDSGWLILCKWWTPHKKSELWLYSIKYFRKQICPCCSCVVHLCVYSNIPNLCYDGRYNNRLLTQRGLQKEPSHTRAQHWSFLLMKLKGDLPLYQLGLRYVTFRLVRNAMAQWISAMPPRQDRWFNTQTGEWCDDQWKKVWGC